MLVGVNVIVTATLDRFNHGRLHRMFCGKTTVVPELSYGGAVQLLAMPTTLWGEDAVIAQQLYKFIWEKSILGRNSLETKHRERFLFLWSGFGSSNGTANNWGDSRGRATSRNESRGRVFSSGTNWILARFKQQ